MLFAEEHARWLLLLHTVLAVAAVGATTHLAIWLWKVRRGALGKLRAARRFAWIAAALHVAAFAAGNLMYPAYKVRVKVSYLQNPAAVLDEADARAARALEAERRYVDPATPEPTEGQRERATADLPTRTDQVSRWFDSKEHWIAMGLPLALALVLLLPAWDPSEAGELSTFVFLTALLWSLTLWFGALVGVVTASWRAVG